MLMEAVHYVDCFSFLKNSRKEKNVRKIRKSDVIIKAQGVNIFKIY